MDMNDCVYLLIEMIQERDSSGEERIPVGTKCVSRLAEIGGVALLCKFRSMSSRTTEGEEEHVHIWSPSCLTGRYTHLCLFPCLAYRVIIAIFLNSIYMCSYPLFLLFS